MARLNYLITSICFKSWDILEDFLSLLGYTPSFHSPSEGPVHKPIGHENTLERGFVKHQLNSFKKPCLTDILLFKLFVYIISLLYCRRWKTQFPFGLTCSNFAALAKKTAALIDNFVFKDLLIHDDAELIITFTGEVSVLHKNSHLVVKELWPQIKISTVRSLMV